MHELGVVFHIIRDLEAVAAENAVHLILSGLATGASWLCYYRALQLGEVSTVIPHYLTDCWKWAAAKNDLVAGAEMVVETLPAVTYCENCGREYPTVAYGRICPHCGSERTYLLRGNEFLIKEIEVPEEEPHG